jgi:hypothetical protein
LSHGGKGGNGGRIKLKDFLYLSEIKETGVMVETARMARMEIMQPNMVRGRMADRVVFIN